MTCEPRAEPSSISPTLTLRVMAREPASDYAQCCAAAAWTALIGPAAARFWSLGHGEAPEPYPSPGAAPSQRPSISASATPSRSRAPLNA